MLCAPYLFNKYSYYYYIVYMNVLLVNYYATTKAKAANSIFVKNNHTKVTGILI